MKRIFTVSLVVFVLSMGIISAQNVSINATGAAPNTSAMLDISSNNMGLLVPRVALTQTTLTAPVTTPATSLLVYNTATINDVSPGYYYWDGSQWVKFVTGSLSDDWALLGNAGTNPATNFLGTTDARDLVIRTNNTEKMRIESGGYVGIGTNNPAYKLHIYGTSNNAADIYSQTDAARIVKHWFVNANRRWSIGQIGSTQAPNYSFQITDETAGAIRMSFTTAGFIGVATTTPSQEFDINGDLRLRAHIYDSNNSAGNNGDILSRDAGGVVWVSPSCESHDESFESDFGIWTNLSDDNADWTRRTGSTTSSLTGPTSANDGSYYIYCETSSPRVAGDVFSLQTNVRTCDNPSISFDYHMYFNTATDGTLNLEVSTDNGSTWTSLWSMTGNQGNVWNNDQTISLAAYPNSFISLRFSFTIGSTGTSYQYDCALDDILLSDISGVYPVSGGSSGDDWTLLGNAGTNPATNFIGTTDNQEFSIRTNNTEKIRVTTRGQIEPMNTGNSVFIGLEAGQNDDLTTNYNTFVGYHCGRANTSGSSNVGMGNDALLSNTTGSYNIAFGINPLEDNTTGSNNIALGNGALTDNITGNYNIAHGAGALSYNTAGIDNIAIGHYAANRNQSSDNIAIGEDALRYATTTCDYNIAIGHFSMRRGTDYTNSIHNIAIGDQTLYSISGGDNNIALGQQSMYANTTGSYNIALGYYPLRYNSTGTQNNAQGYHAMYYATTANDYNVAIGINAMRGTASYINTDFNVAIGSEALFYINGGDDNIAIGQRALYRNTTGYNNVAIGYWACQGDVNGISNTGVGRYALYQNQGNYNSAFGYAAGAGAGSPTYTYCSFLGYDSDATGSYTNAMALGYSASVTATNYVRIGNTSVTRIGGNVGWTNLSDARIKENVQENVSGIDFIMKLRPVTYNLNKDKQDQIIGRTDSSEYAEKYEIEKIKFTGFIAQEVEQAALEVGYDFSGVKKPANENDLYGLTYSEFVVPLVKATQEQQELINQQQTTIQSQQEIIDELQKQNEEILQRLLLLENKE